MANNHIKTLNIGISYRTILPSLFIGEGSIYGNKLDVLNKKK